MYSQILVRSAVMYFRDVWSNIGDMLHVQYSQTLVRSAVMYFRDVFHVQSNIGEICCDVFQRRVPCTVKHWSCIFETYAPRSSKTPYIFLLM